MTIGQRTAKGMALGSLLALAACSAHHHRGGAATHWSFFEVEPNNGAISANVAGPLRVGYGYDVFGHITDDGSDPFDGFVFYPEEALELEFVLTADNPYADLELCFVEPIATVVPICWGPGANPLRGFIDVYPGEEVHLIVSSLWDASSYTLEVYGNPPVYYASTAAEAAEAPGAGAIDRGRAAPGMQAPDRVEDGRLGDYVDTPGPESSVPAQVGSKQLEGELIVVDGSGSVHSFALGADARGPFIEPREAGSRDE